jgi:hypothetical protein
MESPRNRRRPYSVDQQSQGRIVVQRNPFEVSQKAVLLMT